MPRSTKKKKLILILINHHYSLLPLKKYEILNIKRSQHNEVEKRSRSYRNLFFEKLGTKLPSLIQQIENLNEINVQLQQIKSKQRLPNYKCSTITTTTTTTTTNESSDTQISNIIKAHEKDQEDGDVIFSCKQELVKTEVNKNGKDEEEIKQSCQSLLENSSIYLNEFIKQRDIYVKSQLIIQEEGDSENHSDNE